MAAYGPRIVVIGNAGGGKSTLARHLAAACGLAYVEIDRFFWLDGWQPADVSSYDAAHSQAISEPSWVIDGLGRWSSIEPRLGRSTDILLVDLPLWVHFWLAAERQIAWCGGQIEHPPAGLAEAPPTEALFRTIWEVDRTWMPELREQIEKAETKGGKRVTRITTLEQLDQFKSELEASI